MSIRVGLRPMARPAMGFPPGWLRGWDYRKSHTITGSVAGAQANYQVGIKVYYGSGTDGTETVVGIVFGKVYTASKCQTDFSDIRFTGPDGVTPLDYWLDEIIMGFGSDFLAGGTASASSEWPTGGFVAAYAFDNNTGTRWSSDNVAKPHWIKYDLGVGVTKTARGLRMLNWPRQVKDFKLQGSNNDLDWDDLLSGVCGDPTAWYEWEVDNETAYRYYRIYITTGYEYNQSSIWEIELTETLTPAALFWVEVDSIPVSPGTATIYMYYGKVTTTTSDGEATFLMFDDFPGTSVHEDWNQIKTGSAYISVSGGIVTLDSVTLNATCRMLREGNGVWGSFAIIYRFKHIAHYAIVSGVGSPVFYINTYYPLHNWAMWFNGRQYLYGSSNMIWNTMEVRPIGNNRQAYLNGVYLDTNEDTFTDTRVDLFSSSQSDASHGGKLEYSLALVRMYCSPEPTHTAWGSEET